MNFTSQSADSNGIAPQIQIWLSLKLTRISRKERLINPLTFNGYGEYFILKGKGVDFTLQGRMEPILAGDGSPSKAMVYTAFAAK
ncbi:hypothetical protein pdam_00017288 [Pocillopora damicornis]|uniref:Uncharacterized protein n=1 Tax=Pocillopora damicornis TaxID=46731 RepID=A0A3M6U8N8_POCDA|nr:hypothetical protein pdam_00017288 [Pocillopora damicornis]